MSIVWSVVFSRILFLSSFFLLPSSFLLRLLPGLHLRLASYAGYSTARTSRRSGRVSPPGSWGSSGSGMVADAYFTWWKDAERPFSFYHG